MNKEQLLKFLASLALIMTENKDELIKMDSVVGDGDLGLTMSDGFNAAYNAVKDSAETDLGKLLYFAGKAMANAVPSTMGTLMANGLMSAGKALKGKTELNNEEVVNIFEAYEEGVTKLGKAKVGDKTFLDGFHPALVTFKENVNNAEVAKLAYDSAHDGYLNTKGMLAVHGRAATRGENSRDLLDPGAYVASLIFKAYLNSLN